MFPLANTLELPGLQTIVDRERLLLAPYAMHSVSSQGRKHPDLGHSYRGPYQRDRDRILHSAAFRRLSGKMQVFTGDMGDYHRTRLTHTQEVSSIARTLGRALRLNEDLIEALALLHDIGHPPFGHAGEQALNDCLASEGGFSHNRYALTIVEELEARYARFPGLNLTREVLAGQETRCQDPDGGPHPLLEAQIVNVADSISYNAHDTDDAVKLGLVRLEELQEIPLVRETLRRIRGRCVIVNAKMLRKAVVHELIDWQVNDVLRGSGRLLAAHDFDSPRAAQRSGFRLGPGTELAAQTAELESFLYRRVYRHPQLVEVRRHAQHRLGVMFEGYLKAQELLPGKFHDRARLVGDRRCVGDYLAGMTDRYCEQRYSRQFARLAG